MRLRHAVYVLTAASLLGFLGCRNDRREVGVYYPPPQAAVVAPAAPRATYAPPATYARPAPTTYARPVPAPPAPPVYEESIAPTPYTPLATYTPPEPQVAPEVLTRGPVHEAFAAPVVYGSEPGVIVSVQPPAPVEEVTPAEMPAGALWIPGYWSWDDDRTDFLWISGIWRVPPPNCSWVPGYWFQVQNGYQWSPGFWLAGQPQQITYLPPAPPPVETEPIGVAPSIDDVWVPGCYIWQSPRYSWRPGFWMAGRAGWVWVPAHYVVTPRGCVFIDGYWDYVIERRGLLFAPVYFGHHGSRRLHYTPTVVIDIGGLMVHLWSRPSYRHYYFGDYYEARYSSFGIYPWYACRERRGWYDPIYTHQIWRHRRDDPRWDDHERADFDRRRNDPGARPPRTFADEQRDLRQHPDRLRPENVLGRHLTEIAAGQPPATRFERLSDGQRRTIENQGRQVQQFSDQRVQWESGRRPGQPAPGSPPTIPAPPSATRGQLPQVPERPTVMTDRPDKDGREKQPRPALQPGVAPQPRIEFPKGPAKQPEGREFVRPVEPRPIAPPVTTPTVIRPETPRPVERPTKEPTVRPQPKPVEIERPRTPPPSEQPRIKMPAQPVQPPPQRIQPPPQTEERVRIPKPPVSDRPVLFRDRDKTPPPRPETPKVESGAQRTGKVEDDSRRGKGPGEDQNERRGR
jgi:hypothetical protein